MFACARGLDLAIQGKVDSLDIVTRPLPTRVIVLPSLYDGMKFDVLVEEGQKVRTGTPLLASRLEERIIVASPATGVVEKIERGAKRALLALVLRTAADEPVSFKVPPRAEWTHVLKPDEIVDLLLKSGLWPFFRRFPFHAIPAPESFPPAALFCSTFHTEPFLPDPALVLSASPLSRERFLAGLEILSLLVPGGLVLAHDPSRNRVPLPPEVTSFPGARHLGASGPYPAHHPGVLSFRSHPLEKTKSLWWLDPQEVMAVGELFTTGSWLQDRVISVCGSKAENRGLFRVRTGTPAVEVLTWGVAERVIKEAALKTDASPQTLLESVFGRNVVEGARLVFGGIFTGDRQGLDGAVGSRHYSIHLIPEGEPRRLLAFAWPGFDRRSLFPVFASSLVSSEPSSLSSDLNGGVRACISCGACAEICPVDLLPQFLFKSVLAKDLEEMEELGLADCVDCGLCTFACPSKIELGQVLMNGKAEFLKEMEAGEE